MPRVRHYKTTAAYRGDGTTIRTVQSRGPILGPYSTPADRKGGWIAAGLFVLLAWPWFITALEVSVRTVIAVSWYVLLVVGFVVYVQSRRKRHVSQTQQNAVVAQRQGVTPMVTPDDNWASYDGGITYVPHHNAPLTAPVVVQRPHPASPSVADEIAKLAKLREQGILTEAEFTSAKARLLTQRVP